MTYEKLLEQIQALPADEQKALVSEILNHLKETETKPSSAPQARILGLHAGSTVFVADDFDLEFDCL